ncbi:MAG: DUF1454 family protein [Sodalis sp. (in: enterobacteria)]
MSVSLGYRLLPAPHRSRRIFWPSKPTFNAMMTKFRECCNVHNPTLPIGEFRILESPS